MHILFRSFIAIFWLFLSSMPIVSSISIDLNHLQVELTQKMELFQKFQELPEFQYLERSSIMFERNRFQQWVGQETVFVHYFYFDDYGFGNQFGFYLEGISCAKEIGAHYIGILRSDSKLPSAMEHAIKFVIEHDNPRSHHDAVRAMRSSCQIYLPWQGTSGAWTNNFHLVKPIIELVVANVAQQRYQITDMNNIDTVKLSSTESDREVFFLSNLNIRDNITSYGRTNEELISYIVAHPQLIDNLRVNTANHLTDIPLIPDVLIQLRCDDVVNQVRGSPYGFINFNTYVMIIPKNVKYIHITTYTSKKMQADAREQSCNDILTSLVLFFTLHYPTTVVNVLKNSPFESILQMNKSPITICSSSTFCFWPAMASSHSVYFPLTSLFLGGKARHIHDSWTWITYPKIIHVGEHLRDEYSPAKFNATRTKLMIDSLIFVEPQ